MKKDLRFEIDQLRKDKMIYSLESIALTFISELFYFTFSVVTGSYSLVLAVICLLVPLVYFIYAMLGNLVRYRKIRELERKL
jgi:hypothetical protein